jgi:DNA-binding MurR/RpiR family transcriptional regulator
MVKGCNLQALEEAAQLLATAPRVRTHGLRQFYAVACFTSYALGMLRPEVSVLGNSQHGVAHGLAQLDAGDVLVVAGSYPYTRGTVAAARIAGGHGIPIIALTDSSASPLAASATHAFIAPTQGTFFCNSMASYLVLAEALLTLVAARLGDGALAALKDREAFIRELNIEL